MMYMLDTNILIYIQKNNPPAVREKITRLPSHAKLCMSFVSYAELLSGAQGSRNPEKARENIARLVQIVPVLLPETSICEHYARWRDALKRQGAMIGGNDLWIAAHALAADAVLVTHNTKEFARIGDLKWEDWTAQ